MSASSSGVENAVRIGDFPEHFDETDPLVRRHAVHDCACVGEQLHEVGVRPLALRHQFGALGCRKPEPFREQPFDRGALFRREFAVLVRGLQQQNGDGEAQVDRLSCRGIESLQEILDQRKHARLSCAGSFTSRDP
jgi:hypothetical protein